MRSFLEEDGASFCLEKRSYDMLKIIMFMVAFVGGGVGLLSTLYIVVSLLGMIAFKVYRKIKYGISLFN